MLLVSQQDGGRGYWEAIEYPLITEIEGRNVLMAHLATWISYANGLDEPGSDTWSSPQLEEAVERLLYLWT